MTNQLHLYDYFTHCDTLKPLESTDYRYDSSAFKLKYPDIKVFSCFCGGGGSSMGYKLAGLNVLGGVEIDPKMARHYQLNLNPKYLFNQDIREFNARDDLPCELYNLDILDGSPPCTLFSLSNLKRLEYRGKARAYVEGVVEQTLDDLMFVFADTVNKLQPKIVIMENVPNIFDKQTIDYVERYIAKLKGFGYTSRCEVLNGEALGIPQSRSRAFIISTRLDFNLAKIDLHFNYRPTLFSEFSSDEAIPLKNKGAMYRMLMLANYDERTMCDTSMRVDNKYKYFTCSYAHEHKVLPTITTKPMFKTKGERGVLTKNDLLIGSTFPTDYKFESKAISLCNYICGMSVPPLFTKRIATRLLESKILN